LAEPELLLVFTNVADSVAASQLARGAIERRLAACANVSQPTESIYRWQGKIECATEVSICFKTTNDQYEALESFLLTHHSHELPEIVAIPVTRALAAYKQWVIDETNFKS
jgi:periplasmic divalent cation tolerance protein